MLERFPRRGDARLFLAVALGALVLGSVAVVGSVGQVGRTFPGFVVWDNLLVVAVGRPGWTGTQAAVPLRTRLRAIDDRPLATREQLGEILGRDAPETPHRYAFETRTGSETRTVASMRFRWSDWAATMGVYVVNGLVFLVTALAVFYLKPEAPQSRALLAFGVSWGLVFLLLAVDLWTAGRLQYLYVLLEPFVPASVLHLILRFPEPRGPRGSLVAVYAASALAGVVQVWAFWHAFWLLVAIGDVINLTVAIGGILWMVLIAVAAVARATPPLARRRARVVLAGTIAAFGIQMPAYLAFFLLGEPASTNLLILTGFLFPLSIGYAVARHDLFEADRFVKRTLVYASLTVLVTAAYGVAVFAAQWLAAGVGLERNPVFPIAFVLVMLAALVPVRDRVQGLVDRLFFRGRVDFKDTIAAASERMTTLLDRGAVVQHVLATMRDVLFLEGASVWEREGDAMVCRGGVPGGARLPAADPGLRALERHGQPLSRDEAEQSARLRGERAALLETFARLRAALVVPLQREGGTVGLLAIGGKASGGALSADDLDVLRTLANETAVALGNAAAIAQLADARERLARSERLAAIGELSAAVAHGIRNPLAGIRLAAQLGLEAVERGDPVTEDLRDVLVEVDKLEGQVRGILDFARPFEPRLEPVELLPLLRSLLETLAPRFQAAGVRAEVDVPPAVPPLLADRAHLGQALQELLTNALDAMPSGGRISLTAEAAGDGRPRVRIAVADTGPGIPPEVRDRVFQLFMTTKATGTGVGLAVVRKIVERHGGTVALDPTVGLGTRFVLELPAA